MPGLDTDVVVHRLPLGPDCKPIKQELRRMKSEWAMKIQEEMVKQYNAGLLEVVDYLRWFANITLCRRKMERCKCVQTMVIQIKPSQKMIFLFHVQMSLLTIRLEHAMFTFKSHFQGITRLSWRPQIEKRHPSSLLGNVLL